MSKGRENTLVWPPLKQKLIAENWHHQRFEDKLSMGIPDVNIHVPDFGDIWIELKHIAAIKPKVNIGLRREQYLWLRDAQRAGRNCYLLARAGNIWLLWSDVLSWEIAKHSAEWKLINNRAEHFDSVGAVVENFSRMAR